MYYDKQGEPWEPRNWEDLKNNLQGPVKTTHVGKYEVITTWSRISFTTPLPEPHIYKTRLTVLGGIQLALKGANDEQGANANHAELVALAQELHAHDSGP